ncbi:FHA domain-containing protein [Marinobacter sp. SS21]|uniref:FHA domain-containing protein n=1 Tax=Marinobacter sp. SS21 TaxID=2979460 RepID=UPI00232CD8C9|nr:FHA domain-containing protein [Marinobacter sp. SS21]MDC0663152.1 FHA domain-containing protein [Marinobacter sp. SS21]
MRERQSGRYRALVLAAFLTGSVASLAEADSAATGAMDSPAIDTESPAPQQDSAPAPALETDTPATESGSGEATPSTPAAEAQDNPGADASPTEPASGEPGSADAEPGATIPPDNRPAAVIGIGLLLALLAGLLWRLTRNRQRPTLAEGASETAPASQDGVAGYLHIADAGHQRTYTLSQGTTSLGRSGNNDIVLSDDTVSANHLVIKLERNGGVLVSDLNSSNGTRLNGKDVVQAAMVPGDTLELGKVMIRFAVSATQPTSSS